MEEERLELKRKLRKQALHRGQRAVELGLTVEDLAVAELVDEGDRGELHVTKTRSEPGASVSCFTLTCCISVVFVAFLFHNSLYWMREIVLDGRPSMDISKAIF